MSETKTTLTAFSTRIGKYLHNESGEEFMVVCLTRHAVTTENMIVYTQRATEYWVLPEPVFLKEFTAELTPERGSALR